ncbi:COG4223 family protein [Pacificibacter marinus]|uniref:Mitochondrial inner membrane protein n=1 Tax=Pacificibacter marinus TaxID=658057 RepID=A0A1Y5SY98_9RHOB|nr:hypothetical protein [Pacificibacter marinus]SEL04536.1 hypothetical protein SAMN04488032_11084 [Pacificibacter marinus]SLN51764.1 hypothetical protein PAM7971_02573 [Pacificibacter marinus]
MTDVVETEDRSEIDVTDAETVQVELDVDADKVNKTDILEADAKADDLASSDASEDLTPDVVEADTVNSVPYQASVHKKGFFPLLLGGVVCVGLGFAGANFLKPEGWPFPGANTTELQERLTALEGALAETQTQSAQMSDAIEMVRQNSIDAVISVDDKIAEIDLSATVAPIESALAAIEQRLTAVEAAPVAEAIVSPEATAAYERQLQEMQSLLNSEVARLKEAKVAAENEEANAANASAAARLQEAITTGQPYAAVLANLDMDVPNVVRSSATTGIPTLQEISTEFEGAADLAIVETAKSGSENQGWMDRFLRTQLGLRSLTPQDGMSPDAIISRAQQAIRDNDLQIALTEISTLPDVGQAAMADWVAHAQTRLDVTNALSAMLAQ